MTTEVWLIAEDYDDWERNEKPILGVRVEKFHVWENGDTELTRISDKGPESFLMNMGPRMIGVQRDSRRILILPGMFIVLPRTIGDVRISEDQGYDPLRIK